MSSRFFHPCDINLMCKIINFITLSNCPVFRAQHNIMGFVFTQANGSLQLNLTEEWYEDLEQAYQSLNSQDAVNELDMQEDIRNISVNED